ncbi:MAG TPA: MFS transporter [Alicycliphilus sp.]|nr:MFS transporter [Alicycliphilus sp.]HRP21931.1 MFS transporter [Alicycliphilus sp.]
MAERPRIALAWLATVVLVTLNLRPFLTAIGPLTPTIQAHTGLGLQALAWLTLLPMALMGAGTWLAPALLPRLGARPTLALALTLLALGCALRLAPAWLLATAALCGVGVALVQGTLPGLIKLHTPRHVAPMMGVYSASLMGGGALGAQLSPLALQWGLGWNSALALWTLPVLAALALAWWQLGRMATPAAGATQRGASAWLLRRPRTWYLMLAFGLMNGGYASMIAWLAPHYQELGWSAAQSGALVALLSIAQAAAALLLPVLAARGGPDRRPWLWFTLGCQALGFALLAMAPLAAPLATAIVLGVGLGGCFTFFMLVALDHLRAPLQAGALNALMQGGGFLLSALPPWLMARLHQGGGSFSGGWWLQCAMALLVAVLVARLAPTQYERVMQPPVP